MLWAARNDEGHHSVVLGGKKSMELKLKLAVELNVSVKECDTVG